MVCEQIRRSESINQEFDCRYINLSASRSSEEVSQYGLLQTARKLTRSCTSFLLTLWHLIIFRPHTCYLTITCHGIPFLKDAPFVLLCKLFGSKIILHQHNKGMKSCSSRFIYRLLMSLVYRNTTVVLLSWKLYEDVSDIVKREQIRICPNGI